MEADSTEMFINAGSLLVALMFAATVYTVFAPMLAGDKQKKHANVLLLSLGRADHFGRCRILILHRFKPGRLAYEPQRFCYSCCCAFRLLCTRNLH